MSAEYAYNNAGEPTSLIRKAGSSTTTFGYSYDLNGNLLQETENGNVVNAYTYDDLNRLATETDKFGTATTYGFNANGNITSKVMTYAPETSYTLTNAGASYEFTNIKSHKVTMMYNAKNQLQTRSESITGTTGGVTKSMSSSELFTAYTNDGSLKSKKETLGTNLLTKSYWYNDRSQMIAYKENNVTKAEYTYDAEGYRASKIVDGKTTCFYWDRGYTINESDGTSFKAQNVVGLGGIVARKTTGTPMYLFKDVHGDTTMLMQGTSQKGTYDYDVYGKQTEITGTADNPYRYCGEYTDEETGFIYLRNRYYDPSIGRFISEDPAKDGSNWYVYCGNNPVKFVDPTGLTAGQINGQTGYGGIYDSFAYVNDKYQNGWSSKRWGTLEPNVPRFVMNRFQRNANNCTLTAITRIFAYHRNIYGKSNIPDNMTLYNDIKTIAEKYGYSDEDGLGPTKINNVLNDAIEKYGYEGKGRSIYIWNFDTVRTEIDAGRPLLLNIASGYYENHTVTVVGYSEFEKNGQTKKFLKVYDGWVDGNRYIDYDKFVNQSLASFSIADFN